MLEDPYTRYIDSNDMENKTILKYACQTGINVLWISHLKYSYGNNTNLTLGIHYGQGPQPWNCLKLIHKVYNEILWGHSLQMQFKDIRDRALNIILSIQYCKCGFFSTQ